MYRSRVHLFRKNSLACIALWVSMFSGLPGLSAQKDDKGGFPWPQVESALDRQQLDSALLLVKKHCEGDYNCLYQTCKTLVNKLERRFNLPAAIRVTEEILDIARANEDREREANARLNLYRFHDALGNARSAAFNIDKALQLFGHLGNRSRTTLCKIWKLNSSLKFRKAEEILPAMDTLLKQAIADGDAENAFRLRKYLVNLTNSTGQYDKMAGHLDALEAVANPNPATVDEKYLWITIWRSRGDIRKAGRDFSEAGNYYSKALGFCVDVSDRWLEIKCRQQLAETAWALDRRQQAKDYIDKAFADADTLKLDDLLSACYQIKAHFAETEGRYADALAFTKKMYEHRDDIMQRGAGHNAHNYFLEVEKENTELELGLRNTQMRYTLVVSVLVFLLAAGFFIGYQKQRQGKRKLAERNALISMQAERLADLDSAKSRFFANVSHELRTPLTLLLGPVQTLLKENRLTERQNRLLQTAIRSGKQLEQLVAEILDLRKLESGKMELNKKPTDLAAFFRNYLAQFESLAEYKKIDYSFEMGLPEGATADIDRPKCRQIVYNLLSNAFKFTPEGGRIEVEIALNGGTLGIRVANSGSGIHPDDLPHVFDRFFQTTRPEKPVEGGTGIGLNLCREYVLLFGGTIGVESAPGEGAVFRVSFPVSPAGDAPAKDTQADTRDPEEMPDGQRDNDPTPSADGWYETLHFPAVALTDMKTMPETSNEPRPTVLVVEDNPDLQEYIRLILSDTCRVVTAEHGQAALECMEQDLPAGKFVPDLILSDLMMPVMDGFRLLERLKSADATRHIPVVMLTARADVRDKLKALRIGVDDYLLKPFDEEELLTRIDNLLKNRAARQLETAACAGQETPRPTVSQPDREWLESFEAYVQKHFSSDILSVSALAREFAMSESTLLRQVKRLTGLSPLQYLQEVRLDEARRLLENRSCNSIAQVASKTGYDDARSFARSFRHRFGRLPSEMMGE